MTSLHILREAVSQVSATRKYLIGLGDGEAVETVHMDFGKRQTVCISTQVGCAVGCSFCATGMMGLKRNLTAGEIVGQIHLLRHSLNLPISNIVFMGMGEPFHNYDEVMKATRLLTDSDGYGISMRRLTISTSGVVPAIRKFTLEDLPVKLAISLGSLDDSVRDQLMPINKRYPVKALFAALEDYARTTRHRITFEYVLLKGINDREEDVRMLRKRLGSLPSKLNLIVYNPTDSEFQGTPKDEFLRFYEHFLDAPFPVTFRQNMGTDIDAACGQLWTQAGQ